MKLQEGHTDARRIFWREKRYKKEEIQKQVKIQGGNTETGQDTRRRTHRSRQTDREFQFTRERDTRLRIKVSSSTLTNHLRESLLLVVPQQEGDDDSHAQHQHHK